MSFIRLSHGVSRLSLTTVAGTILSLTICFNTASAQERVRDPDPTEWVISRSVGPRNALTPEVGRPNSLRLGPGDNFLPFGSPTAALSDSQAAEVVSGFGTTPSVGSFLQQPMEALSGNDNIRAEVSGGAGVSAVGGMVGSAVSGGLGTLSGALSGLAGLGQ